MLSRALTHVLILASNAIYSRDASLDPVYPTDVARVAEFPAPASSTSPSTIDRLPVAAKITLDELVWSVLGDCSPPSSFTFFMTVALACISTAHDMFQTWTNKRATTNARITFDGAREEDEEEQIDDNDEETMSDEDQVRPFQYPRV